MSKIDLASAVESTKIAVGDQVETVPAPKIDLASATPSLDPNEGQKKIAVDEFFPEGFKQESKDYGLRKDGTPKGKGFLGELQRPDGKVSTELSVGIEMDGKETEIPAIVSTSTQEELDYMMNTEPSPEMWKTDMGKAILNKAVDHAKYRGAKGKGYFADPEEEGKVDEDTLNTMALRARVYKAYSSAGLPVPYETRRRWWLSELEDVEGIPELEAEKDSDVGKMMSFYLKPALEENYKEDFNDAIRRRKMRQIVEPYMEQATTQAVALNMALDTKLLSMSDYERKGIRRVLSTIITPIGARSVIPFSERELALERNIPFQTRMDIAISAFLIATGNIPALIQYTVYRVAMTGLEAIPKATEIKKVKDWIKNNIPEKGEVPIFSGGYTPPDPKYVRESDAQEEFKTFVDVTEGAIKFVLAIKAGRFVGGKYLQAEHYVKNDLVPKAHVEMIKQDVNARMSEYFKHNKLPITQEQSKVMDAFAEKYAYYVYKQAVGEGVSKGMASRIQEKIFRDQATKFINRIKKMWLNSKGNVPSPEEFSKIKELLSRFKMSPEIIAEVNAGNLKVLPAEVLTALRLAVPNVFRDQADIELKDTKVIGDDGIIDKSVDVKFGTRREVGQKMAGVDADTVHYIAFSPDQVKVVPQEVEVPAQVEAKGDTSFEFGANKKEIAESFVGKPKLSPARKRLEEISDVEARIDRLNSMQSEVDSVAKDFKGSVQARKTDEDNYGKIPAYFRGGKYANKLDQAVDDFNAQFGTSLSEGELVDWMINLDAERVALKADIATLRSKIGKKIGEKGAVKRIVQKEEKIDALQAKVKDTLDAQKLADDMYFGKKIAETTEALKEQIAVERIKGQDKLANTKADYKEKLKAEKAKISDAKAEAIKKEAFQIASQKLADEINFGKKGAKEKSQKREVEYKKAVKDAKKRLADKAKKLSKLKLPSNYNESIEALLEEYDLGNRTAKTKFKRAKRKELIDGLDDLVDMAVLGKNFFKGIGKTTLDEMTLGEIIDLEDKIEALAHAGLNEGKLNMYGEMIEEAEVALGINDQIAKKTGYVAEALAEGELLVGDPEGMVWGEKFKEGSRQFFAINRKAEFVADKLGISKYLTDPIMSSADKERIINETINNKVKEIFKPVRKEMGKWNKQNPIKGVRKHRGKDGKMKDLSIEQEIGVTLNTGNVDNIERLLQGNKFLPVEVKLIRDYVMSNPVYKQLVNDVWDLLESLRPYIAEAFKATTGVDFKAVSGRYFTIMYDRSLSDMLKIAQDTDLMKATLIHSASVKFGSVKERTGTGGALNLTFLEPLYTHIQKAIRYSAYAGNVKGVDAILHNPMVKNAIEGSMNKETFNAIETWLKRVANPFVVEKGEWDEALTVFRYMATQFYLGANVSVSAVQALSFFLTIGEIGVGRSLQGLTGFYLQPLFAKNMHKFIMDKSSFIRARYSIGNLNRELRDMMKMDKFKKLTGTKKQFAKLFFIGITLIDYFTTMPSWLGGYYKGLKKYDGDIRQAEIYADKVARKTQPTGGQENLTTFMSGNTSQTLWSMFMSFTSTQYNQIADMGFDIIKDKDTPLTKKSVDLMVQFWWKVLATSFSFMWIKNAMKPKEKQKELDTKAYLASIANTMGSGLPYIREITSGVAYGYSSGASPSALSFIKLIQEAIMNESKLKQVIYLTGMFTRTFPKSIADLLYNQLKKDEKDANTIEEIEKRYKKSTKKTNAIDDIEKRYKR